VTCSDSRVRPSSPPTGHGWPLEQARAGCRGWDSRRWIVTSTRSRPEAPWAPSRRWGTHPWEVFPELPDFQKFVRQPDRVGFLAPLPSASSSSQHQNLPGYQGIATATARVSRHWSGSITGSMPLLPLGTTASRGCKLPLWSFVRDKVEGAGLSRAVFVSYPRRRFRITAFGGSFSLPVRARCSGAS
jgi:hypothetical protein